MGISKLSETFANRTHQQLNPQMIRSANDYSELCCTSFHRSHLGFCKCSYSIYFSFSQSFVLACVKCSFSGKSSIFVLSNTEMFFLSLWKQDKLSWIAHSTLLCPPPSLECTSERLASCCPLVSSYQSRLRFPHVYTALMHMCLSSLPTDGLDVTKCSAK